MSAGDVHGAIDAFSRGARLVCDESPNTAPQTPGKARQTRRGERTPSSGNFSATNPRANSPRVPTARSLVHAMRPKQSPAGGDGRKAGRDAPRPFCLIQPAAGAQSQAFGTVGRRCPADVPLYQLFCCIVTKKVRRPTNIGRLSRAREAGQSRPRWRPPTETLWMVPSIDAVWSLRDARTRVLALTRATLFRWVGCKIQTTRDCSSDRCGEGEGLAARGAAHAHRPPGRRRCGGLTSPLPVRQPGSCALLSSKCSFFSLRES